MKKDSIEAVLADLIEASVPVITRKTATALHFRLGQIAYRASAEKLAALDEGADEPDDEVDE